MKCPNYLVLSQKISNECTLEVVKYIWNVVDDIVRSHYIIAMNAFSILLSCNDIIPWCASPQIGEKKLSRKMENAKLTGTGWQNSFRIRGKVEKLSAPYDAECVQKGVLYHRKGEEKNLWFWLQKGKFLVSNLGSKKCSPKNRA